MWKIGQSKSFKRLAQSMNEIAENEGKHIKLNQKYLLNFFKINKGKQLTPLENPLLRKQHKIQRLEWERKWNKTSVRKTFTWYILTKNGFTQQAGEKIKFLPLHPNETPDTKIFSRKNILSRRFPCKVMFIGAVAPPNDEHDFNGCIFLNRVAKRKKIHPCENL